MALQLGQSVNALLFLRFTLMLQVGADVNIAYYDHKIEQQASQWNNGSNVQEYGMTACPPWKYHRYYNSTCLCGSTIHDIVDCKDNRPTVYLLTCHCMSYEDKGNNDTTVVMGACPFLCTNYMYTTIYADTNLSSLCNSDIQQNRRGQMCGKCKDNHSPSPYSYQLKCARCSHYKYNWLKYLLMAYLPLTVFFVMVVFFRFSALSASMNAFIFFSQMISSPAIMSLISTYAYFSENHPGDRDINVIISAKVMATFAGIWNLDFFRMLYEPFCLHPKLSIIQIMCLDYAVAMYPLLLIILTYMFFKFYEGFELVQFFVKPLVWLFAHFIHQLNISNSLIEAFATFILLSYVKVINTSFDILMPTQLYNVTGQVIGLYVYYNGSLEYLGHDHLPYAVLAIFMFTTFNLIPLFLLCLYPCRCFQSCLNWCQLNSQVLRTFMDAFQGCYKFEPYDCRYWAAFYLFLRIVALFTFATSPSGFFVLVCGIVVTLVTMTTAIIKPYRKTLYNITDVVFLLIFVQLCFSAASLPLGIFNRRLEVFLIYMLGISSLVPLVYITVLSVYKILPNSWITYIKVFFVHCHRSCLQRRDGDDPLRTHNYQRP